MARSVRTFLFGTKGMRKGEAALDWWTLPHIGSGVVLALLLAEPWLIAALLILYELFEGALRRVQTKAGAGVFEHESWPNIVADVLVALVPWLIVWIVFPSYEAPFRMF